MNLKLDYEARMTVHHLTKQECAKYEIAQLHAITGIRDLHYPKHLASSDVDEKV